MCLCFSYLAQLLNNCIVFSNILKVLELLWIGVTMECVWLWYCGKNAIVLMHTAVSGKIPGVYDKWIQACKNLRIWKVADLGPAVLRWYVKPQHVCILENPSRLLKMTKISTVFTDAAGMVEGWIHEEAEQSSAWSEMKHSTRKGMRGRVLQRKTLAVGSRTW